MFNGVKERRVKDIVVKILGQAGRGEEVEELVLPYLRDQARRSFLWGGKPKNCAKPRQGRSQRSEGEVERLVVRYSEHRRNSLEIWEESRITGQIAGIRVAR